MAEVCHQIPKDEPRNSLCTVLVADGKVFEYDGAMSERGLYEYFNKEQHKRSKVIEPDLAKVTDMILGVNTPWHETY